jgi:alkanesulfonate monooxygenase SsuD/methylene tetrahydromethanopterin reductase-like flavin-dependent oxidoreductase (luciferase family)
VKFGFIITGGEAHEQVALAQAAEAAGWDGVFTWDGIHVGDDIETYDPWALMAAFAGVTQRVILGAIIHPLPRRKPWEVARQAVTVDRLSNGRLVLAVGLGALDDAGVTGFGEPQERRVRAERLDESLEILAGLWSGEPYEFHGRHYDFPGPLAFRPTPVQRPRIPIWVVGAWPSKRSMSRVVRYDGLLPYWLPKTEGLSRPETPDQLAEMRDWIAARRDLEGFDIIMEGATSADDAAAAAAAVEPWAAAGATWWIESDWSTWDPAVMRRRIEAGPPRSSAPASIAGHG